MKEITYQRNDGVVVTEWIVEARIYDNHIILATNNLKIVVDKEKDEIKLEFKKHPKGYCIGYREVPKVLFIDHKGDIMEDHYSETKYDGVLNALGYGVMDFFTLPKAVRNDVLYDRYLDKEEM